MEIVILVIKISINIDSSDSYGHPTFLTLWTVFVPVFSSARGLQRRRTTDCLDPCPRLVTVVFLNKPSTQLYYQYKSVSLQQDWPFFCHLLWLVQNTFWVFSFLEKLVYSWCKPNKVAVSGIASKNSIRSWWDVNLRIGAEIGRPKTFHRSMKSKVQTVFVSAGASLFYLELDGCSQSDLGLAFALKQSSDGAIPKRCGLHSKADPEGGLTFL